jgi:hypothetical protein
MNDKEPSPSDYLGDSLSPLSRAERRNLLLASFIGFLIATAGLVPAKISAFEIELNIPEKIAFTNATALIILYFLLAFITYALSDFLVWRKKYQDYKEQVEIASRNWTQEDQFAHDELHETLPNIAWLYKFSPFAASIRNLFDYLLPIIFASYSMYVLLTFKPGS